MFEKCNKIYTVSQKVSPAYSSITWRNRNR